MKTNTQDKILEFIRENGEITPHQLGLWLGLSQVAIHKQLRNLVEKGKITRLGQPPQTRYGIAHLVSQVLPPHLAKSIDSSYLYATPTGKLLPGVKGFVYWATEINHSKNVEKLAESYVDLRQDIDKQKTAGEWFDVTSKLSNTFDDHTVQQAFCSDFYSLPMFGKTKLGTLLLYAKQSQNRQLMTELIQSIKPVVDKIIVNYSITHLGFIPPSVPRQTQLMSVLAAQLHLPVPIIPLTKIRSGDVIVPQKTLTKLSERVENAKATIAIKDKNNESVKRVLLIDDALGSGATLHETAVKIAHYWPEVEIYGYTIVSSFKGFDVILEV